MAKRVKLPINMSSKYQRKCPVCRAPMVNRCLNCSYSHKDEKGTAVFERSKS